MPGLKCKCRHCKTVSVWPKAIDHELDMLETTGEDPACLDTLSALAAEMEEYQLLKDNQSLSQGQDTDISTCPVSMSRTATEPHLCGFRGFPELFAVMQKRR
ncbi:TPA: hypothetical protein ACH3X2_004282 [Trebouxia sp. C0005]